MCSIVLFFCFFKLCVVIVNGQKGLKTFFCECNLGFGWPVPHSLNTPWFTCSNDPRHRRRLLTTASRYFAE
jgi:hypothetical protein